ncbi:MAG TPA: glycoside hydrolase family 30 protein [Pyrinomonadaceae bacterium]|nr:glycoside hydrolase family 30 protein [Pyrinomonadaceae bacterium]
MKVNRRDFLLASSSAMLAIQSVKPASAQTGLSTNSPAIGGRKATVYTTAAKTNDRLTMTGTVAFEKMGQPLETQTCVFVDPSRRFQTIVGIGGAITDASAETFAKLPPAKQQEFLDAYYDPHKGIGYTLARTNIHSCDFSSGSYTYVAEGDTSLRTFNVAHDRQFRLPLIKRATAATGGSLKMFASPWSPPAFMKTNGDMLHGGKLKPEHYQTWANYFAKFIKAYQSEGAPVWAITIQNEPMATQKWESCIFTAEEERDFLKLNLGPTLQRQGLADKKIIIWDHNRDLIYQRTSTLLNDPAAAKFVWGIGYHWYEPWSGGDPMYDNVKLVHETFPDKNLIFTEGCAEAFNMDRIHDWSLGERYGSSMINDFNNGTVGWTDWNILLDERGGPNHVANYCFAPVHADTRTGELIFTNSFYYIGHFSKFVRPGARCIACSPSRSSLKSTAFVNPDGTTAVVVMNKGEKPVDYFLWISGQAVAVTSPPHSMQTTII